VREQRVNSIVLQSRVTSIPIVCELGKKVWAARSRKLSSAASCAPAAVEIAAERMQPSNEIITHATVGRGGTPP